jgi:MutS domain V
MKAFLMYGDRDFGVTEELPPNTGELTQDLGLEILLGAMSGGDEFLYKAAQKAILGGLSDAGAIRYRQGVLADSLEQTAVVREMYGIAVEALESERKVWGWLSARYPEGVLRRSVQVMQIFAGLLTRLRDIAREHGAQFRSEGFANLFRMLESELSDEYLGTVREHLERLTLEGGVLISATLGKGKGAHYVLHKPREAQPNWMERLQSWIPRKDPRVYELADRDEGGWRALSDLKGQAIQQVAGALAQSTEHVLSFFSMLRWELGFYVGCLNLREQLARKGEPICFPEPSAAGQPLLTSRGLYDPCLSLTMRERVVGNDVSGDGRMLIMITGANQGGKSTFLRSVGVAQLMMQCGMFVAAESFRADLRAGLFTHFVREEDARMQSGKLDEELSRMSAIVDRISPGDMILLNESLACTNEREGSEIARQIVRGLLERGIKVLYVTHLFELAHGFFASRPDALLLRAERLPDGSRTFRVVEGEPLPTSHGADLYRRMFGESRAPQKAANGEGTLA